MKKKYWIEVVNNSEPNYDIVDCFIESGCGQIGGYSVKSGNNEKEHCLEYWGKTGNAEEDYECSKLRCHEMLLHIAKSFNIPNENIIAFKNEAIDYVTQNGRELLKISPIAGKVMELIKETKTFKHYDSIEIIHK